MWTEAEIRLWRELKALEDEVGKAKGTAGRLTGPGRGKKNGGAIIAPPFTGDAPTRLELGLGGAGGEKRVARAFETSRRREVLSFTHHREVAGLPPATADALLDEAEISKRQVSRWKRRLAEPDKYCATARHSASMGRPHPTQPLSRERACRASCAAPGAYPRTRVRYPPVMHARALSPAQPPLEAARAVIRDLVHRLDRDALAGFTLQLLDRTLAPNGTPQPAGRRGGNSPGKTQQTEAQASPGGENPPPAATAAGENASNGTRDLSTAKRRGRPPSPRVRQAKVLRRRNTSEAEPDRTSRRREVSNAEPDRTSRRREVSKAAAPAGDTEPVANGDSREHHLATALTAAKDLATAFWAKADAQGGASWRMIADRFHVPEALAQDARRHHELPRGVTVAQARTFLGAEAAQGV